MSPKIRDQSRGPSAYEIDQEPGGSRKLHTLFHRESHNCDGHLSRLAQFVKQEWGKLL